MWGPGSKVCLQDKVRTPVICLSLRKLLEKIPFSLCFRISLGVFKRPLRWFYYMTFSYDYILPVDFFFLAVIFGCYSLPQCFMLWSTVYVEDSSWCGKLSWSRNLNLGLQIDVYIIQVAVIILISMYSQLSCCFKYPVQQESLFRNYEMP